MFRIRWTRKGVLYFFKIRYNWVIVTWSDCYLNSLFWLKLLGQINVNLCALIDMSIIIDQILTIAQSVAIHLHLLEIRFWELIRARTFTNLIR